MIKQHQKEPNQEQIEIDMMQSLKGLYQKYQIRESWVMQFVNQNIYLSNFEITQFISSCQQIALKQGDKLSTRTVRQDYIYCLLQGRAKIMRQASLQNNWELKRLKLVSLHNYKVITNNDPFCIIADSTCQFLRFKLPFTRQQQFILSSKRSFLCHFFDVDFNRINFDLLDLFKPAKYIVGDKISNFNNKIIIVKQGACNYSYNGTKLVDKSEPLIINYDTFIGDVEIIPTVIVKSAEILCFEASIQRLQAKSFYHSKLIKAIKNRCSKQYQWLKKLVTKTLTEFDTIQNPITELKPSLLLTINKSNSENKIFYQSQNTIQKDFRNSKLTWREKRTSLQFQFDLKDETQPYNTTRKSVDSINSFQDKNPQQSNTIIPLLPHPRQLFAQKINFIDLQTTIINKKKIFKDKMKIYGNKQLFLYYQTPNTQTHSFQRRMIQSGVKIIQPQKIRHTDSSKKIGDLKNKYIKKIELSNRIGVQGIVIHSNSLQNLKKIQRDPKRSLSTLSTKRLSNSEYHNYLVHGDLLNPKQEPLQKIHSKVKMLRTSATTMYNHNEHLKNKSKLFRYSSTKIRSANKQSR